MFSSVRLFCAALITLSLCHPAAAQYFPEDDVPLDIQQELAAELATTSGQIDVRILAERIIEWRQSQPISLSKTKGEPGKGTPSIRDLLLTSNPPLYDCIVNFMGEDENMEVTQLVRVNCRNDAGYPYATITDISQLNQFTGLHHIFLSDHDIDDVSATAGLPNLLTMDLSGNTRLGTSSSLDSLINQSSLEFLTLNNIGLTSLPAWHHNGNPNLLNLNQISLSGNPIAHPFAAASCLSGTANKIHAGALIMDGSAGGNSQLKDRDLGLLSAFTARYYYLYNHQFQTLVASGTNCDASPGSVFDGARYLALTNSLVAQTTQIGVPSSLPDLSNLHVGVLGITTDEVEVISRGMPLACESFSVSGSAFQEFNTSSPTQLPPLAPKRVLMGNLSNFSCSALDEIQAWHATAYDENQILSLYQTNYPDLYNYCQLFTSTQQAFVRPASCQPDQPPGDFNVVRDTSTGAYYISWLAVPPAWGNIRYELGYREVGQNINLPAQIVVEDNVTSQVVTHLNTQRHYEFALRVCSDNAATGPIEDGADGCSPITAWQHPNNLLAPVSNINILWQAGSTDTFRLQWTYSDFYFQEQRPDYFEILNLDNPDPSIVFVSSSSPNLNPWQSAWLNLGANGSNIYQIRACGGTHCGPVRSVTVLPDPVIAGNMLTPTNVEVTAFPSNSSLDLSWNYSDDDGLIDYFQINEFYNASDAPIASYFVDRNDADSSTSVSMKLMREDGEHGFSIAACRRNRQGLDSCSTPSDIESDDLPVLALNFGNIVNQCYVDHVTPPGTVDLQWEYSGSLQPSYFKGQLTDCEISCFDNQLQDFIVDAASTGSVFTASQDSNGNALIGGIWDVYACRNDDFCEKLDSINASPIVGNPSPQCSTTSQESSNGGPSDLTPGIWWNQDYTGSGWYFYWANRLQNDETHEAYGNTYDLFAFWATYRLFDGHWQPVWLYSKLKFDGTGAPAAGLYRGDLVYPHSGDIANHENIGHIEIQLNDNGFLNPIELRLQSTKEGGLSTLGLNEFNQDLRDYFVIELNNIVTDLLDQPEFNTLNRYDHLSGLWSPCDNGNCLAQDALLLNFINSQFDGNTLLFYDNAGEPIWMNAVNCSNNGGNFQCIPDDPGYTSFSLSGDDLRVIESGVNPFVRSPAFVPADHQLPITGSLTREFGTGDTEQTTGTLEANISMIFGENNRTAQLTFNEPVQKQANLSDIRYFINGSSTPTTCELDANGRCLISLTWYTDAPYPRLIPHFRMVLEGDNSLDQIHRPDYGSETPPVDTALCSSDVPNPPIGEFGNPEDAIYSVEQYECYLQEPGNYRFYLFNEQVDPSSGNSVFEAIATSRVLTVIGAGDATANLLPQGNPAIPDLPTAIEHGLDPADINLSAETGATQGQFTVDASGAATYNLPIYTVPATGDVAPQVALSYSSQAGGGAAGHGWSISGLSMVTRCANTYEQDDQIRGVQLDSSDKFCLDGQRLISINGGVDGASGTEYRTEVDIIARVRSYGTSDPDNGPRYFKVERKDGSVSFYGDWCYAGSPDIAACPSGNASTDSFIQVPGNVNQAYAWAIDLMKDSANNDIRYSWQAQSGSHIEVLIDRIDYTGNLSAGLTPYAHLKFNYETLAPTQQRTSYIRGISFRQTQFLDTIESITGSNTLRRYNLEYLSSDVTPESRFLGSVTECTGPSANEICYSPLVFEWQFGENVIDATEHQCNDLDNDPNCFNWDETDWHQPNGSGGVDDFYINVLPIDFTGNGQQDVAVFVDRDFTCANLDAPGGDDRLTSDETYEVDIVSYTPDNNIDHHALTFNNVANLPCHVYPGGANPQTISPNDYGPQFFVTDYNADTFQDLIYLDDATLSDTKGEIIGLRTIAGNPVTFATAVQIGELHCGNAPGISFSLGGIETIRQSDINGDGLPDIVYSCGSGHSTYRILHNGDTSVNGTPYADGPQVLFDNTLNSPNQLNISFTQPDPADPVSVAVRFDKNTPLADFNGDGAVDLLVRVETEVCIGTEQQCLDIPDCDPGVICFPQGPQGPAGFLSNEPTIHRYAVYHALFADGLGGFNNDSPMPLYYDTCDSYFPDCTSIDLPGPVRGDRFAELVDMNNDQLIDLVYRSGTNTSHTWQMVLNNGVAFDQNTTTRLTDLELCEHEDGNSDVCDLDELTAAYVQFTDLDGNGYTDILYTGDATGDCGDSAYRTNSCTQWNALYNNAGQFVQADNVAAAGDIDSGFDSSTFADVNGDGLLDHIYIDGAEPVIPSNPRLQNVYVALARTRASGSAASTTARATNVITLIDTGIGLNTAKTQIQYGLMTDHQVYSRGVSGHLMSLGNGAVVYDLIPSGYLVQQVDGSNAASGVNSLGSISSNSLSSVRYYYEGARIQAGGRGFLGFEVMHTYDLQTRLLTSTQYHQNFPFIGSPIATGTWYVPGAAPLPWQQASDSTTPCINCVPPPDCNLFGCSTPEAAITIVDTSSYFLLNSTLTEWDAYNPIDSQIWFPYQAEQYVRSYTPETNTIDGAITAQGPVTTTVVTSNSYISTDYGNLVGSTVQTFIGDCETPCISGAFSSVLSSHTYADNVSNWHLGRLKTSSVHHLRDGAPSVDRSSEFGYDPDTGILVDEWIEKGTNLEVHTHYDLDDFGNQEKTTVTYRNPDGSANPEPRVTESRYDDAQGRFVDEVVDANGIVITKITNRDLYGNPLQVRSVNGKVSTTEYDPMGRALFSQSNTGTFNLTTYKAGTSTDGFFTNCPSGTMYHRYSRSYYNSATATVVETPTAATGAVTPAIATCYDVLGREIRSITAYFKPNQEMITDTRYDHSGRTIAVSRPKLNDLDSLPGHSLNDWTISFYDALSRIWKIRNADNSVRTTQFGIQDPTTNVWNGLITVLTNEIDQTRTQLSNPLGEPVEVIDDIGGKVRYAYDAVGNLIVTNGSLPGDVDQTVMTYNERGHKLTMHDPDKGFWQYRYNSLGELVCQMDGNGDGLHQTYDKFGRVTQRTEYRTLISPDQCTGTPTIQSNWSYDGELSGVSALTPSPTYNQIESSVVSGLHSAVLNETTTFNQVVSHRQDYAYDSVGRVNNKATTIDGTTYHERTVYDEVGRIFQQFSAHRRPDSPIGQRYLYNNRGYQYAMTEAATQSTTNETCSSNQTVIYDCTRELDRWGNVGISVNGAGNTNSYLYDDLDGRLNSQITTASDGTLIYQAQYLFDDLGNLEARASIGFGRIDVEERFEYDALNRLTSEHRRAGPGGNLVLGGGYTFPQLGDPGLFPNQQYRYDGQTVSDNPDDVQPGPGNLTYNSSAGDISYGGAGCGPHAACSAGSTSYIYDANGNQTQATTTNSERSIYYTVSNHPWLINDENGQSTIFAYDAERNRYKREDVGQRIEHTVGNAEILVPVGQTTYRYNVGSAILRFTPQHDDGASLDILQSPRSWVVTDHLGSMVVSQTENATGTGWDYDHRQYQTFGTGISARDLSHNPALAMFDSWTEQGFTGHESINSAGIIHMGGRIYDPSLGRFLQADPFVQDPENSQNLNRYSYVLNNPLSYTDPSGYFHIGRFFFNFVGPIATGVACIYGGPAGCAAANSAFSLASGASFSQALKAGVIAGVQTIAFTQIGVLTQSSHAAVQISTHAVAGGLFSELQGGSFLSGAISSGLSKGFGTLVANEFDPVTGIDPQSTIIDNILISVVGGTTSLATGGSFANGAITGAIAYAYNQEGRKSDSDSRAGNLDRRIGDAGNSIELSDQDVRVIFNALFPKGQPNQIVNDTETFNQAQIDLAVEGAAAAVIGQDILDELIVTVIDSATIKLKTSSNAVKRTLNIATTDGRFDPQKIRLAIDNDFKGLGLLTTTGAAARIKSRFNEAFGL